ncbi:MAG TPA: IS91 family transposase [Polyangiales bacterium]|nr:IS91 family transposase [Polyangiales bacterium]
MVRLADVLCRHGPDYQQRHGPALLPSHARAVRAITQCRTAALGGHLAQCTQCSSRHVLYHSCRHRACPRCGHDAANRWLAHQESLLLPVQYFHVVFTLPSELRRAVRSHQRVLLGVLFRAAFESLAALCADPRYVGGRIGALAVLHTWTRTLEWHPHVHMLVPAGALGPDGRTWLEPKDRRKPFLVPVRALSELFRGRFLRLARAALPHERLAVPWSKRWVVFSKPAVQGAQRVLQYLGRYVHRTALTDKALLGCDERTVRVAYRHSADGRSRCMTLPAQEFLRRFLQHVPAKGLHRVRAFGLLHPAHRAALRQLQLRLAQDARAPAFDTGEHDDSPPARPPLRCPRCHTPTLRLQRRLSTQECIALASAPTAAQAQARAPPSLAPSPPSTTAVMS